jgi:hypothetical protein
MRNTQAVKMDSKLAQRGLEIAKEKGVTHGKGVEFAVLELANSYQPETEETNSDQALQEVTKAREGGKNGTTANRSQAMSLVSLDTAPVQTKVKGSLELRPSNLELTYVHALANQAMELSIATSRQVLRDLSNRVEGLALPEAKQIETYLGELEKRDLHPKVLEQIVSVISAKGLINGEIKVLPGQTQNNKALLESNK